MAAAPAARAASTATDSSLLNMQDLGLKRIGDLIGGECKATPGTVTTPGVSSGLRPGTGNTTLHASTGTAPEALGARQTNQSLPVRTLAGPATRDREIWMKLMHVVGARPNFVKIAPIYREVASRAGLEQVLVHTGQHYDPEMSGVFFEEFGLPEPDINLRVGSSTHAAQTAEVMLRLEPALDEARPDWLVVVGDVNSTLAATLVAVKKGVRVAHVEAGLRSFDRRMPEEINRILTDSVADLLLTPSRDGDENLIAEGVDPSRIRFVGNVMIDTLAHLLPRARERWPELRERLDAPGRFALVTLHRPGNVDGEETLREIVAGLKEVSAEIPVLFAVHPRTRTRLETFGIDAEADSRIRLLDPLGYVDFLALTVNAALVITDSGGIQEETTFLGTPCLTVRPNTERPVTISQGTNRLVDGTRAAIVEAAESALGTLGEPGRPELWDGKAAGRIVDAITSTAARPPRS
jgi:UDP-N-acetylglucosamine 2-epimerase (non-hydrolysing)